MENKNKFVKSMQKSGSVCHVVAAAVFHLTDISVMIIAYMIITAYLFFFTQKEELDTIT